MRVLLVAPTIDSTDVGEAWVAFQWAAHLAGRCELTVLTYRKRGAAPVPDQLPGVRVVEWLEPAGLGRLERFNSLLKPGYFAFERKARRWIREALARGERFDVGHQVVPVAMRYPSPLRGTGIPYVIGPVGGSLASPPGFSDQETGPWYLKLRALDPLRLRLDPALRATYERADLVLGIADYVRDALKGLRIKRLEVLSETGLPELPDVPARPKPHAPTEEHPLRLLFVGRVIRTKGARDLIAALPQLADLPVRVDIVGDGFDLAECKALAAQLGVSHRVHFHGRQPKPAVQDCYRQADIFVFPSYREPGGNVVFEAMGNRLPLIVCDRGGPGASVDASCAIALPAESPEQLASALAGAIRELAFDPERRQAMGEAARVRLAKVGLWPSKLDRAMELYDEVVAASSRDNR